MGEVAEEIPLPAGGKVIFSGIMKSQESHDDTPNSQKTEKTLPSSVVSGSDSDEGVDIPHFMRPLLGMDFMPFLQSSGSRESTSKSSPEPSPKGAVIEPKTKSLAFGTDEIHEEKKAEDDDLDDYAKEYAEIVKAAKRKKKKKKFLRLIRKSLGGKTTSSSTQESSEKEDFGPSEDVNISMSTCESFSLQSLDNCDDDSVLTSDFLNSSNLDTSVDNSVSSTISKKSPGRSFFKRKGKKSKSASVNKDTPVDAPSAQGTLKWLKTQQGSLQNHQSEMNQVQSEMLSLQQKSNGIQKRMLAVTDEIAALQSALQVAEMNLRNELNDFGAAKTEMARLEKSAEKAAKAVLESFKTIRNGPPGKFQTVELPTSSHATDAATAPTPKIGNSDSTRQGASFQEPQSDSEQVIKSDAFMRVHDLNIENNSESENPGFMFVDDNLKPILENLAKLGLDHIRDESERFKATRDTKKTLSKYQESGIAPNSVQDKDVLVWMGDCGHKNHGCKWPVVKAKGLIKTSPKELAEFLLDSSRIKEYNEMSQGRDDVVVFQQDLHTSAEESVYGLPGAIKVLRSRNKPKLLPKAIEITSLMYAKPLEDCPGTYMLVNRSIFEDTEGTLKNDKEIITSEMLLGVNLIRPADDSNAVSEFNSITHIFPPGVPEFLAKKVAPSSASSMIKDIQKVFE